jgi:transcriptional regulator with XRE-family HTH domain
MARSEQQFIDLCKKQIEQKFSFGDGHSYTQRDLEVLSAHIEEKTGVIISLSTLKRLWKDRYKHSPQLATLNALAIILDHKDWQGFKQANQNKTASFMPVLKWVAPALVLFIVIWISDFGASSNPARENKSGKPPVITGPVYFEASKTVASGIPNTVIFKYDVSNVVANTFYIQQSWNSDHRVAINPEGRAVTSIYYESGFHRAKLIANDSVIALQPVHIISNGWEPHIYHNDSDPEPVDLKNEKFSSNGLLHLDSSMLARKNLNFSKRFLSRITNSQPFNLHSDNFSFSTRMKADRISDQLCAWMDVIIVTDVQTFMVSWTEKGCEKYAGYKLGEISRKGKDNDLSALGCDVYSWQELEVHVEDRHAVIYLNGQPAYQETYRQDFGMIVALIYIFDGTGSIDYSRLEGGDGQVVFEDDFEE